MTIPPVEIIRYQIKAIAVPSGYEPERGGEYETSSEAWTHCFVRFPSFFPAMVFAVLALFYFVLFYFVLFYFVRQTSIILKNFIQL